MHQSKCLLTQAIMLLWWPASLNNQGDSWHTIEIQESASPTSYRVTSFCFPLSNWGKSLWNARSGMFLQSWTSTRYFSNSTRSFVTPCWFSLSVVPAISIPSWELKYATNCLEFLLLSYFITTRDQPILISQRAGFLHVHELDQWFGLLYSFIKALKLSLFSSLHR